MYQCQDCTYKGKHFPGGACPGCGSRRIKRLTPAAEETPPKARRSYRMWLAWALWAYLLFVSARMTDFF